MSTPRTIDDVMRDMNAWAMAEGIALDGDPWSIPPADGSILDIPLTPEAKTRTAGLRARRLARAAAARHASEQVREQCLNSHTGEERIHVPDIEDPKVEVPS